MASRGRPRRRRPPAAQIAVVALPEQIVWLAPALAVATWAIVIVMVALTRPQGPGGSLVVKVNVALPAAISAAVGM